MFVCKVVLRIMRNKHIKIMIIWNRKIDKRIICNIKVQIARNKQVKIIMSLKPKTK